MSKTLQEFRIAEKGIVKGILLILALGVFTFMAGLQAKAQTTPLPTNHDGPWATMSKTGWSQSGLGADYTTAELGGSPASTGMARFDSAGD